MLPTEPYGLEDYSRDLEHHLDGTRGFTHLYDIDNGHPIYTGLADTPMIKQIYRRAQRRGILRMECTSCLHNAVDMLMAIVGREIYQTLDNIDQVAAATIAVEMMCEGKLSELPQADNYIPMREIVYGNLLAKFARATAPANSNVAIMDLVNRCQAPYSAHLKALDIYNRLSENSPVSIQ